MLRDRSWRFKYTAEEGSLVRRFYVPALEDAKRYDRLTGYFNAGALALAARGIECLVRNEGRMRLVVGCTLEQPEIEAIHEGAQVRDLVERHLADLPLAPPDLESNDALELLAWMVAREILEVKVAVPCDADGMPGPDSGIFHEKTGIIEDRVGDRLAWSGSLNETGAGWQNNWESISVCTSWGSEPARVDEEEANFSRIWTGEMQRVIVLDVPEAARQDLMRFLPARGLPARLAPAPADPPPAQPASDPTIRSPTTSSPLPKPEIGLRDRVWKFIQEAPSRRNGRRVGETTAAVDPWPHQAKAFERLYENWPPRLLIADEVGLGKTIQAGLLLRQAWLAGRAERVLILAPKAVLGQWQIELREKFNLNWPIYDGRKLAWQSSPALRNRSEREARREDWHAEAAVIASSQLLRRDGRAEELLERADPWDLVVLDEAHHARRRGAGGQRDGGPNNLLKLMRGLKDRTQGLVLLTATPMQVHPAEVWDLLHLLGLPPEWTLKAFLEFFDDIEQPIPSAEAMERMAALFRSAEHAFGEFEKEEAQRIANLSRMRTKSILRALRHDASIPRRKLDPAERRAAIDIMRAGTPVRRLVLRNTRELLKRYFQRGMTTTPVAERDVDDRFLEMTDGERRIYRAIEDYISSTCGRAGESERSAVGFVMTIYRRRLASSFMALRETLQRRRNAIDSEGLSESFGIEEDLPDDEAADEIADADEAARRERRVLAFERKAEIGSLLDSIRQLPPDSKLGRLREVLRELRRAGRTRTMVFTQFTDTMDFLRTALLEDAEWKLLCFSGRGGEQPGADGAWRKISRDEAKNRFRAGEAEVMLCTDAAAEGLNFQFCGALVNYDMPWNPMRVEQRIGRIDRLGQEHETIRIINLHYEGTIEADIYRVLRERIDLFQTVVGRLQPILARLPERIAASVLAGEDFDTRANLAGTIERELDEQRSAGFDIDAVAESDLAMPDRPQSPVTMEDLDRVLARSDLMPPNAEVRPLGAREYSLRLPGMEEPLRVTTDPAHYEQHPDNLELWSPGNPLFLAPEIAAATGEADLGTTLKDILDSG